MTQAASPFVWGAGGARMTPEQIAKQREIAEAMIARGVDASPVKHWAQGAARVAQALLGAYDLKQTNAAEKESNEYWRNKLAGAIGGNSPADMPGPGAAPVSGPAPDISSNDIAKQFLDTAGSTITNPYGLAALAATGQRESSWLPGNLNRTWPDKSEKGQPGTSGGALSWRGPRLADLQNFARSRGETGLGSAKTQAEFFLQENPRLIAALNAAKSPDEAIAAMNNAWRFAGFNRPGGEAAARLALARSLAPQFKSRAADVPAPGASPMTMPGAGEGFAVPTQGVAETEADVQRMELATGMRPPSDMETLFAPQQMPGAPAFQPAPQAAPPIDRQAILDGYQIGAPAAPSMTQAPIEPGVGMPPQQVAAPLPPPRPADLPAPGAREAVAQAMMPQTGVYGRSGDGSEWELYQYEDDNGRIMYGTRARGAANSPGQSLAPADTPGAGVLTGQGGGIARVAQAMMGGGGQATAAPVAAPAASGAPAGAAPAGGAPAASGGRAQQLIMLATDPTVPGSVRQVAMALYQQEVERNKPRDLVIKEVNGQIIGVDSRSGQAREIYRGKPKDERTNDEKLYDRYVTDERAAGRQPVPLTDWMRANKSASATRVNIDGGGSDKQVFDNINESAKAAQSAVQGLSSIKTARDAVKAGGIFGAGADVRLGIAKLGTLLGLPSQAVENTETFRAAIAPQVAALMKATVGSTQISNADREFAEKAAGGSINLDEKSILRLLNVMEKASRAAVASHRDRLNKVYPERPDGRFERERALFGVPEVPEEPAPPPAYEAVNPQTDERMISDDGKTWRKP